MKILLQNKKSLNYVQGTAGGPTLWTPDSEKAHEFPTGIEALLFCLSHRIRNMQILGRFLNRRMDFVLSVTDLRGG